MSEALALRSPTALVHVPRPVLYRFDDSMYSESSVHLVRRTFPVTKWTKCGAWIDHYGDKKFVLLTARKRFACRTVEEALQCFRARKKRQVYILRWKLARAEAALKLQEDTGYQYLEF